ncbi:MAG: inorganic phosphate transporter [Acidobacteria bacterium]|nr:inorganic phosphate transporter [Acidobacteriota bacterium]
MTTIILLLAVFWLAYSNGANDNFKGVATLYGSATASYKKALLWATIATAAGSLVSVVAANELLAVFSGKGLVPQSLVGTPELLIAVGIASAITVFLATWLGLPTSTTHALIGALLGVAVVISPAGLSWGTVVDKLAGPLLLSPAIAIGMAAVLYLALRRLRLATGITKQTCVCLGSQAPQLVHIQPDGAAVLASSGLSVSVGQMDNCVERYQGQFVGVDAQTSVDAVHYLSAGAVCFSRAVNDTPKIAALLLAAPAGNTSWGLVLVATTMVLGGVLNSRRVAETMSKRITDLNPGQGLTANLVTALLVLLASPLGLPVSTTHVSCGSIFGVGLVNRTFQWKTVAQILMAWVTTLPLAAIMSGLLFWLAM